MKVFRQGVCSHGDYAVLVKTTVASHQTGGQEDGLGCVDKGKMTILYLPFIQVKWHSRYGRGVLPLFERHAYTHMRTAENDA